MTYITLQENWLTKGVITNLATVPGFLLMKASIANFAVWCPCHERRRFSLLSANCWSSRHALPLVRLSQCYGRPAQGTRRVSKDVQYSTGDATLCPAHRRSRLRGVSPRSKGCAGGGVGGGGGGGGGGSGYQARADERSESGAQPHAATPVAQAASPRSTCRPVGTAQRPNPAQPSHQRAS